MDVRIDFFVSKIREILWLPRGRYHFIDIFFFEQKLNALEAETSISADDDRCSHFFWMRKINEKMTWRERANKYYDLIYFIMT